MIGKYNVLVQFGLGIPPEAQAQALMNLEKNLRAITKLDVRVFKDKMGDDSKIRQRMTPDERSRL